MTDEEREAFEKQEKLDAEETERKAKAQKAKEDALKDIDPDILSKLVAEQVDEKLKDIKGKLDSAYGARDEALEKTAVLDQKIKEAELEKLKEAGKFEEAHKIELAEERAKNKVLTTKNVELTRDISVRGALNSYEFRNERAFNMATKEIVANLVQDDKGEWVHKSGQTIKECVDAFAKSDDNQFLFKAKKQQGSGSKGAKGGVGSDPKSLFKMSQKEVLEGIENGTIKRK